MADDASTASNSAPGPSQPAKRTSPAKRASAPTTTAATAAAAPAGKKATATAANKTPVGTKRNAAGVAKQGNGGNGANGKAAKDDAATVADEEEEEVKGVVEAKPSAAKKLKTSKADVSSLKNGINVFEDGSAGADAGAAAAGGDDEGGVEYA